MIEYQVLEETLLKKLREEGLTYKEIEEYLSNQGIKVPITVIRKRMHEIYGGNLDAIPKADIKYTGAPKLDIPLEQLIRLRQQGFSYREIAYKLNAKGIKVSPQTVENRIKELQEKEPEIISDKRGLDSIPDNKLKKLKEQGLSCKGILEYLTNREVKVTLPSLKRRLRAIYENGDEKMPKAPSKKKNKVVKKDSTMIIDQILKLRETKNATDEQMAQIAKSYGINIDGTRINRSVTK